MTLVDTIAAIATPPGHGAIAVVRCSGPQARRIAAAVFRSSGPLVDRQATYGRIIDARGELVDRGLAIAMDAPRTVTGEDIVELHVHGSPVAARETLGALIAAGARLADPGEFTRRSFLNGKMDLSAAEAVADIIAAESRAGVRAAAANLAGGLQRIIDHLRGDLQAVLEEIAGALDFPDEVPMIGVRAAVERVERVGNQLAELAGDAERGRMVREGISVAIVGPPNAGKSSLLNALVGEERAIVSPIAGTTRDTIEERFVLDGVVVRVIDTAGLRASDDEIERIGIERAKAALATAAIAVVVVDGSRVLAEEALELLRSTRDRARVVIFNKRDLGDGGVQQREPPERDAIVGSVRDAESLREIRDAIARVGWGGTLVDMARPHLASARHVNAVARARESLDHARATLGGGFPIDLITADLANAVGALGEITGGTVSEDVLDGIFARFCVGK